MQGIPSVQTRVMEFLRGRELSALAGRLVGIDPDRVRVRKSSTDYSSAFP